MDLKHKAMDFIRSGAAMALAQGHRPSAGLLADARWGADSPASRILKSVPAASTQEESWGEPLGEASRAAAAFFSAVSEVSIIGRMRSLHRVPPYVKCLTPVSGFSAEWRGEGNARAIDAAVFAADELKLLDLGVMTVATKELLEHGSRIAERALASTLVAAVADALDLAFLDPANEGEPDVRPASITHDLDPVPLDGDLPEAVGGLIEDFGGDAQTAYFILHPATAARLSGANHPGLGIRGGELLGAPALTSRHAPIGKLILADGAGIAVAEGAGDMRSASHATIDMREDPNDTEGSPQQISLWQTGSRALLATQEINWRVVRPYSVAMLDLSPEDT
jgi:hypothetical protein